MRFFKHTDGRYYAISDPIRDLFDQEVVQIYRGSMYSRLGGMLTRPPGDVSRLIQTRLAHGYIEQTL